MKIKKERETETYHSPLPFPPKNKQSNKNKSTQEKDLACDRKLKKTATSLCENHELGEAISAASKRNIRQWRTSAGGDDDRRRSGSGLGAEAAETELCSSRDPPFLKLPPRSPGVPIVSRGRSNKTEYSDPRVSREIINVLPLNLQWREGGRREKERERMRGGFS